MFKRFREEVEGLRKEHPNDLNNYIRYVKGCDKKKANKVQNANQSMLFREGCSNAFENIQMEGVLSRDLFSKIASYVFNHYDWPDKLDDDADRIMLEYRTKGKTGRDKITVRKALYKAYMLGV